MADTNNFDLETLRAEIEALAATDPERHKRLCRGLEMCQEIIASALRTTTLIVGLGSNPSAAERAAVYQQCARIAEESQRRLLAYLGPLPPSEVVLFDASSGAAPFGAVLQRRVVQQETEG